MPGGRALQSGLSGALRALHARPSPRRGPRTCTSPLVALLVRCGPRHRDLSVVSPAGWTPRMALPEPSGARGSVDPGMTPVAVRSLMMPPASDLALPSGLLGRALGRRGPNRSPNRLPNRPLSGASGGGDAGGSEVPPNRGPGRLGGGASAACGRIYAGSDAPSRIGRRWGRGAAGPGPPLGEGRGGGRGAAGAGRASRARARGLRVVAEMSGCLRVDVAAAGADRTGGALGPGVVLAQADGIIATLLDR